MNPLVARRQIASSGSSGQESGEGACGGWTVGVSVSVT